MAKSNLETAIDQAAADFAMVVIDAVKSSTLQQLIALQESNIANATPGRKPGRPPKRKPGRPVGSTAAKTAKKKTTRKKRVVKNYPQCSYPGCETNRFPRGKGFCGEHWKMWLAGKVKDAEFYVKKEARQAQKAASENKKPAKKKVVTKKAAPTAPAPVAE